MTQHRVGERKTNGYLDHVNPGGVRGRLRLHRGSGGLRGCLGGRFLGCCMHLVAEDGISSGGLRTWVSVGKQGGEGEVHSFIRNTQFSITWINGAHGRSSASAQKFIGQKQAEDAHRCPGDVSECL